MQGSHVGDARFFARNGPFTLAQVAEAAGGSIAGSVEQAMGDRLLMAVAPLQAAGPDDITFLDNRLYGEALDSTAAGAVIVHPEMAHRVPATAASIVTNSPYEAWAHVAALFHPVPPPFPGVHPTAFVAPGAEVDPSAEIGPFACIEAGARIGARTRVGPFCSIAAGVVVGTDCRLGPHTSLSHAVVGDRVVMHPGSRIGQEGFGFAKTKTGFLTVPQLGRVLLEDDVELGANTTVDRGSMQDTVVGAGSRLDNFVQIAHNVQVGRCCVIVSHAAISGSTVIEDFVQIAGQVGMSGHLRIGKGAQIGAQSGVIADVPPGAIMQGSPAQPRQEFWRQVATLKRMTRRVGKPKD